MHAFISCLKGELVYTQSNDFLMNDSARYDKEDNGEEEEEEEEGVPLRRRTSQKQVR